MTDERPTEIFSHADNYKTKLRLAARIILETVHLARTGYSAAMWKSICYSLQRYAGDNTEEIQKTVDHFVRQLDTRYVPDDSKAIENSFRVAYMDWDDITYRIYVNPENNDIDGIEVASMNDAEDYIKAKLRLLLEKGKIELLDELN